MRLPIPFLVLIAGLAGCAAGSPKVAGSADGAIVVRTPAGILDSSYARYSTVREDAEDAKTDPASTYKVYINGFVNEPGVIVVPKGEKITLGQAIYAAKGFNPRGYDLTIIEARDGKRVVSRISNEGFKSRLDAVLQPGCYLYVADIA